MVSAFPSRQLMIFLLSFLGGVFLHSFWQIPLLLSGELVGFALLFLLLFRGGKRGQLFFFLFLGLGLGIMRFQLAERQVEEAPLRNYFFQERAVEGWVCQEAKVSAREQELVLCLSALVDDQEEKVITGRVKLKTALYPTYHYGDRLRAIGQIQPPAVLAGFNYSGYLLARQGIIASIDYPYLEKLPGEEGFWLKALALRFKDRLQGVINQSLAYPDSALLKALLLGDRSELSFFLENQLAAVGLIHLLAISGLHLIILSHLVLIFISCFRIKEPWPAVFTLIFLWAFVFLVGSRPSLLRAAVMSSFLLVGAMIHRPASSLRSLVWAAFFLLLLNPFSFRLDIGFQLSFLAALGIIWLKPLLVRGRRLALPLDLLLTTLTAQLLIFPLLLSAFGQASLISPLSNFLVTPLLPLILGLGFVFLLFGLLSSLFFPLGPALLGPLFWYLTAVVEGLSRWPGIVWSGTISSWGGGLFYFGVFGFFLLLDPLHLFFARLPFQISRRC